MKMEMKMEMEIRKRRRRGEVKEMRKMTMMIGKGDGGERGGREGGREQRESGKMKCKSHRVNVCMCVVNEEL